MSDRNTSLIKQGDWSKNIIPIVVIIAVTIIIITNPSLVEKLLDTISTVMISRESNDNR